MRRGRERHVPRPVDLGYPRDGAESSLKPLIVARTQLDGELVEAAGQGIPIGQQWFDGIPVGLENLGHHT